MFYFEMDPPYRFRRSSRHPWLFTLAAGLAFIMFGLTIIFFPRILVWLLATLLFGVGFSFLLFAWSLKRTAHYRTHSRINIYDFYA